MTDHIVSNVQEFRTRAAICSFRLAKLRTGEVRVLKAMKCVGETA